MKARIPILWGGVAAWLLARLLLRYAIDPPLPESLVSMYMGLVAVAIIIHITLQDERMHDLLVSVRNLFLDDEKKIRRMLVLSGVPLALGLYSFNVLTPNTSPPPELRTIHPAPPEEFVGIANPLRRDEGNFEKNLRDGAEIYFKNCFFCHGDALNGNGHFADGFNPRPADFTDQGTIAQMPESYIFWRIKTGGPGLPNESQPWNSAMPVWGDFLNDEEIWKVVLYIYAGAGVEPRTWE